MFAFSSLTSPFFASFLLGFVCPLMWYYATILYFGNYYHKDPRERAGLAASAIAVSVVFVIKCTVLLLVGAPVTIAAHFYFECFLLYISKEKLKYRIIRNYILVSSFDNMSHFLF
jgi:hypothetical protein